MAFDFVGDSAVIGDVGQITSDGGGAVSNGMAEFVAQEEMSRSGLG